MIRYSSAGSTDVEVTSDLRFNYSDFDNNHDNSFSMYIFFITIFYLCFQKIKFWIFMLFKHSLDGNSIGDKGGVALGEALKVNMTLQTLR